MYTGIKNFGKITVKYTYIYIHTHILKCVNIFMVIFIFFHYYVRDIILSYFWFLRIISKDSMSKQKIKIYTMHEKC